MRAETTVFVTSVILSFLAFALTMHNVPLGAVELNPIGAFWIGSGLSFVGFIVGWLVIYLLYRFTFLKQDFPKDYKFFGLGMLLGFVFMGFLGDFYSYLYIITA